MPLPDMLEQRLGAAHMQTKQKMIQPVCPPVDPHLLAHLDILFSETTTIVSTHPQLGQLLFIQYGVEKVLAYLKKQYDHQSALARKDHEI